MDLLLNHKTIRKYQEKEIANDILDRILMAGIRASNTGNMQLYSVVVTHNMEMKQKLAPLHFNQPMVTNAPVVLTVCLDVNRFTKWCEINHADASYFNLLWLMNGTIDSMLLAQNVCVAAENEGLGICYLGTTLYNAKEIIEVLKLPNGVIPITTITMGYPAENIEQTDRLPFDAVIHQEQYLDYSDERIKEIYAEKESLESSKQFIKENSKENLAQVFTDVRYKRADNELFSRKLFDLLLEQGFITN